MLPRGPLSGLDSTPWAPGRSHPRCHPPQFCSQDVSFLLTLFPFSTSTALRQGGRGAFCGWLLAAPFPAQAGGLLPSTPTFFISLCCDSEAGRGCRPGNCQTLSGAFVYLSLSVPLLMSLHGVEALYQEDVAASCTPHSGQDRAGGLGPGLTSASCPSNGHLVY